jgi:hypothetical protein
MRLVRQLPHYATTITTRPDIAWKFLEFLSCLLGSCLGIVHLILLTQNFHSFMISTAFLLAAS